MQVYSPDFQDYFPVILTSRTRESISSFFSKMKRFGGKRTTSGSSFTTIHLYAKYERNRFFDFCRRMLDVYWKSLLRTFALIVSAHSYCARNSLRVVMPRHALSACAVEEMWRKIALVGTLISMHGLNSLKCSVTPHFLSIDHFLCRLSTFCEKVKKIYVVEVWFFSTFLPSHHRILLLL